MLRFMPVGYLSNVTISSVVVHIFVQVGKVLLTIRSFAVEKGFTIAVIDASFGNSVKDVREG